MEMRSKLTVGTAGWNIPRPLANEFPVIGSHLQRYAHRLTGTEINSSFYRPHRSGTYGKWARSVPERFQFAVKLPKEITHVRRLSDFTQPLEKFLSEIGALGGKLGPVLVQLPPSLSFTTTVAATFFGTLRECFADHLVCEPRHPTWFTEDVDALLSGFQVARAVADPAAVPHAAKPGGWPGLVYYRLHGSPEMYYSAYGPEYLDTLAEQMIQVATHGEGVWCIFDNTAQGEATNDALGLLRRIGNRP